jgi:hypothetical protein
MTCKSTIRMICEYLEGRLSPQVSTAMSKHLHSCGNCSMVMKAAKQTLEVYFDRQMNNEADTARVA